MKSAAFALLGAIVPLVTAHYTFPDLTVNGVKSGDWTYIRETANHYSNGPVTDVTSDAIRCYELDNTVAGTTQTASVTAGSSLTMTANGPIYHNGAIFVYMSAASDASSTSAGTGQTWFKVYQHVPVYQNGALTFPSTTDATITFTVPKDTPSGQYLVRFEQIALHAASSFGGAQFYIGCAQINVSGGGNGTPGPLVSFPGAYTGNEPGIKIDIYNIPAGYAGYQAPGPAVWGGGSSGSQPSNTATTTATTTRPATTTTTRSTTSSAPTTSSGSSGSSSGAAQYAQCGGQGWTGTTTCQSPYKCTAQNQYYSQCI